jgi:hypothetical protein
MLSPMRLSRATLHPDDRGDRCGARPALVLSSAGNENGGIICDGSNHGSERCSGVSLVVNVGVRQHRGSPAPNTSVGKASALAKMPPIRLASSAEGAPENCSPASAKAARTPSASMVDRRFPHRKYVGTRVVRRATRAHRSLQTNF